MAVLLTMVESPDVIEITENDILTDFSIGSISDNSPCKRVWVQAFYEDLLTDS